MKLALEILNKKDLWKVKLKILIRLRHVKILFLQSVKNKLYGNALKKEGIEQVLPTDFDQAKIGKMVNNIVLNRQGNKDRKELIKIIDEFGKNGVKDVILACTDLQLLIPYHPKLRIYDTMKIFTDATIQKIIN